MFKTFLKVAGGFVALMVAFAVVIAVEKFFISDIQAAPTEETRPIRDEAVAFFRKSASSASFIANDRGNVIRHDATQVRITGAYGSGAYLKASENGGCLTTFARDDAVLGDKGSRGHGWITVDWSKVTEVDDRMAQDEQGLRIRGGISNNFNSKLVLSIISRSSHGLEWARYSKELQKACGGGR